MKMMTTITNCTTRWQGTFLFALALLSAVCIAAMPSTAVAQNDAAAKEYPARVMEKDLAVRSGAGTNYYSFGKLAEGDIVTVVGELYGFARLATKGRAFTKFHGLVPAANVQVAADGKTATTLGRTVISAPNLDREGLPSQSWQRLVRLDVGQKLNIIGQLNEAGTMYYRVALPDDADGWVPMRALRRATEEEVKAYNAKPAEPAKPADTRPTQPANTGGDNATGNNSTTPLRKPEETTPANTGANQNTGAGATNTTNPPANTGNTGENNTTTTTPPASTGGTTNENTGSDTSTVTPPTGETDPGTADPNATSTTTTPPAAPAKPASVERFESLEKSYEALLEEPVRTAEIASLLTEYRNLGADESADERVRAMAEARVAMLEVRQDLQTRLREIDKLRTRADLTREETAAARLALDRSGDYDAVGRLTASTVYTGASLPRLLRIVDPATGRTVAYIEPDDRFDYAGMIGQIVGVSGEKRYDAGLRLTLVSPRNVEMLTASSSTTTSTTTGAGGN